MKSFFGSISIQLAYSFLKDTYVLCSLKSRRSGLPLQTDKGKAILFLFLPLSVLCGGRRHGLLSFFPVVIPFVSQIVVEHLFCVTGCVHDEAHTCEPDVSCPSLLTLPFLVLSLSPPWPMWRWLPAPLYSRF